jgi:hypothetical protein
MAMVDGMIETPAYSSDDAVETVGRGPQSV